jgi:mRNA-degrading endonuclease toxin of MazEF toxin-antitoxin module
VLTRERSIDLLFDVLVAPLTTTIRDILTEVQVGLADSAAASVIDLQHVMTVPKSFLRQRVAVLPGAQAGRRAPQCASPSVVEALDPLNFDGTLTE